MAIRYIDLETIPSQLPFVREMVKEKISPPATYKKEDSIKKWYEENLESETDKKLHDTCFDGTFGEIVCIGWAIDDQPVKTVQRDVGESEAEMLKEFFKKDYSEMRKDGLQGNPAWCAHNGSQFDFRFLWQRCVVNNVCPPYRIPYDAKPWDKDIIDTLYLWKGINKAGGSLDMICKAFGLEGKTGMDGSMVYDEWKKGNIKGIAEYCTQDVEMVRAIYKRMMFL